jgi:hypothetical protein
MHNGFFLNQQLCIIFGVNKRINQRNIIANIRLFRIMTLLESN